MSGRRPTPTPARAQASTAAKVSCANPACGELVRPSFLACRSDWRRLPRSLRDAIGSAWEDRCAGRPGGLQRHVDAKRSAVAWFTGNQ